MKQSLKRTVAVGLVAGLLLAPSAVFAKGNIAEAEDSPSPSVSVSPSSSPQPDSRTRELAEQKLEQQLEAARQAHRADDMTDSHGALNEKLKDNMLKVCQQHQTKINELMSVMDKRRQNAFDTITKITTSVEDFYTKKNLSVSNYGQLVAAVEAAKAAAQTAMQGQQQIPSLDCSSGHPRADIADFKTKRTDSIDAMKAYRDAVKALVQAVKTAAGTTEDKSNA